MRTSKRRRAQRPRCCSARQVCQKPYHPTGPCFTTPANASQMMPGVDSICLVMKRRSALTVIPTWANFKAIKANEQASPSPWVVVFRSKAKQIRGTTKREQRLEKLRTTTEKTPTLSSWKNWLLFPQIKTSWTFALRIPPHTATALLKTNTFYKVNALCHF